MLILFAILALLVPIVAELFTVQAPPVYNVSLGAPQAVAWILSHIVHCKRLTLGKLNHLLLYIVTDTPVAFALAHSAAAGAVMLRAFQTARVRWASLSAAIVLPAELTLINKGVGIIWMLEAYSLWDGSYDAFPFWDGIEEVVDRTGIDLDPDFEWIFL